MAFQTLALSEALWNPILCVQSAGVLGHLLVSPDRAGSSAFVRGGALTERILAEGHTKGHGGRWDSDVSIIAESLQKDYAPMLPALRELKKLLVSATAC